MAAPDRPDLNHRLALTVREAAGLLGVGRDAVYNAINRGDLRAVRLGGTLLVPRVELDRVLGLAEPDGVGVSSRGHAGGSTGEAVEPPRRKFAAGSPRT